MNHSSAEIVVCGAGGFIGGHLVGELLRRGHAPASLRAVDHKPVAQWYQAFPGVESLQLDLSEPAPCQRALAGGRVRDVYNLAADMGGMGFIEANKALCMLTVLINTHLLMAARAAGSVRRFFYASSACVYAADKQTDPNVTALKEADAYPAMPEDGYGWEKLFSERMCRHFSEDFGLFTSTARYHNVYGPHGTFEGGREKAPAAICRKVIAAKRSGRHEIEIWGDGEQTRSFQYIDDCTHGTLLMVERGVAGPLNVGSAEMVTINQLVDLAEELAGFGPGELKRSYNLKAPKGVNGRNSDNTMIRELLGWEPSTPLRDGLARTFAWIEAEMMQASAGKPNVAKLETAGAS